ncbi:hypothetical protein ODV97_15015 [Enterococcus gallinarum]|nr:hypothetical protein [Enterococcus gallinarum]
MNEGNLFDPTCLERPKIFLRNIKKQEALKIDDFECFLTLDCMSRMNELLSGSFYILIMSKEQEEQPLEC